MNIQKNTEWLVVFYIHEIPEYSFYLDSLLELIGRTRMNPENEVWVLLERVYTDEHTGKATFQLAVYRLEVNEEGSRLVEVPVAALAVGVNDKGSLKNALAFLYQHISCRRRLLFTWSHGAGFGINAGDAEAGLRASSFYVMKESGAPPLITEVANPYAFLTAEEVRGINSLGLAPFIPPVELQPGEFQAVKKEDTYDCSKAEILWMSDLAQMLKTALNGKQIDLLVMMNCNMQLFENGFMLREVVKILVGPESLMWVNGYDYEKILHYLSADPAISNQQLAQKIVGDYVAMHQELGHKDYLDNTTLFANSLEGYKDMAGVLQKVAGWQLKHMDQLKPAILDLRNNHFFSVSGKEVLFLLDIKLWMDTVFNTPGLAPPDPQLYQDFRAALYKSVLGKHVGSGFIKKDKAGPKFYGHSGSSLFFPLKSRFTLPARFLWCEYFSNQRSSAFQEQTLWDEFIGEVTR